MNILVIGNGFDLAHGLPTKYTDFLNWIKEIKKILDNLVWKDEILNNEKEVDEWLNEESLSEEREVDFYGVLISYYLDAFGSQREMIMKKNRNYLEEWFYEHGIEISKQYFVNDNDNDDNDIESIIRLIGIQDWEIRNALESDKKKKIIKKKNSIVDILEFVNKCIFQQETDIIKFLEKQSAHSLANKENKKLFISITNNIWLLYFLKNEKYNKENWIDFENEISNIIKELDDLIDGNLEDIISRRFNNTNYTRRFLNDLIEDFCQNNERCTGKDVVEKLKFDLSKLILLLEIYLEEYVKKIEIQKKSPDIEVLKINGVLSFNYTNTYERMYDDIKSKDYDYIHGKANINNTIGTNNMVLGIDEYLPEDRKDKDIGLIAFKKYYQRIYKGTGCKYKDWINAIREENDIYMEKKHDCEIFLKNGYGLTNEIEERRAELKQLNENPPRHNLYIFGHSLDITDRDVLKDLILNDNVYTTIYYPEQKELGRKIANLVKVIGQDELIRRTGGSTKTIEFKLQKPMEEIIQNDL